MRRLALGNAFGTYHCLVILSRLIMRPTPPFKTYETIEGNGMDPSGLSITLSVENHEY